MSLLHQESKEDLDDAARGEEFTKGTSHVVVPAIVSAIVVTIIIAVYVIAGQKPPVMTGEVEQVWVHPMHTETSGYDANGAPMPKERVDQVMVFARIRLHNQAKIPLFVLSILTDATMNDGIHSSYAAAASQYEELFMVHPELAALHGQALSPQVTVEPGQTVEGNIVSAFRMTKQEWDAHKNLDFTIGIRYQPDLVLRPKVPVTEVP